MLFLFLVQRKSKFQKTSGLHASVSSFSLDGLSAGQVLGFSANPQTTDDFDTEKHLPNPSTNTSIFIYHFHYFFLSLLLLLFYFVTIPVK